MIRHFLSREFLLFIVTGGFAALVNFGSRIVYNQWVEYVPAIVLAYLTGMVTAFVLARLFVFKQSQRKMHYSILFFCLVNLLAIAQTLLISIGLRDYVLPGMGITTYVPEIAHATGVLAPVFTSYLGHKYWTFRS